MTESKTDPFKVSQPLNVRAELLDIEFALVQIQQNRVRQAIANERDSGLCPERAVTYELKLLANMVFSLHEMRQSAGAAEPLLRQEGPGILTTMLASLQPKRRSARARARFSGPLKIAGDAEIVAR
jgi:hypothetical protein